MSQPRDVAEVPGSATEVRWYGVVLLVGHLALTVIGAVSLWRIAGGWWVGAAAAALFVLGYLALWRYLLAPGSASASPTASASPSRSSPAPPCSSSAA